MAYKMFTVLMLSLSIAISFAREIKVSVGDDPKNPIDKDSEPYPGYFSDTWRKIYNADHMFRQPKWKLAENQSRDASYEIREYEPAWYVSSYIPCANQSQSAAAGYVRLFIYMQFANLENKTYPLTYPILSKIEIQANPMDSTSDNKDVRSFCSDRYSQHLYLPIPVDEIPAETRDFTISTELVPATTYYVRRYDDAFTLKSQSNCNVQAGILAASLALSGVQFNPQSYFCATYEPGNRNVAALFEVMFAAA